MSKKMEKIDPKEYQTIFRLDVLKGRVTGLLTDFIIRGSLGLGDPIVTFDGKWWSFRLKKKSIDKIAKRGVKIFENEKCYGEYSREFREYLKNIRKNVIPRFKKVPADISKDEFFALTNKMKKFWYYYGMTESVFHDLAFEVMIKNDNSTIKKSLSDLDKLKFEGRDVLNVFLLEDGTIDNILRCVSKKYSIDFGLIKYFYLQELKDLFGENKVNVDKIEKRKESFVVMQNSGEVHYSYFEEEKRIASSFKKFDEIEYKKCSRELKGQIANKGKVIGRVIISPMLDMKAAAEVDKKMRKGDILVVQSTNPNLIALCKKAGAIVTDQGGMLSHAAIISRELKIPCIVGTVNATKSLKDGDIIEVDANKGVVTVIKRIK